MFGLCAHLGYASPDHLLKELTSTQLTEWMAFARIAPFGPQMDNLRGGIVAAAVANYSPISTKHDYTPADFMPRRPKKPLTLAQQIKKTFGIPFEE